MQVSDRMTMDPALLHVHQRCALRVADPTAHRSMGAL
jgi:hypothetical protein